MSDTLRRLRAAAYYWRDWFETRTLPNIPNISERKLAEAIDRDRAALAYAAPKDRAKVICLCGSTRFTDEMLVKQWELTKQGFIVLSWCAVPSSYAVGPHIGDREGVKEIVDEVHKRKIDLCDEVEVIHSSYIGESTRSEIEYAKSHGKPVLYLKDAYAPKGDSCE